MADLTTNSARRNFAQDDPRRVDRDADGQTTDPTINPVGYKVRLDGPNGGKFVFEASAQLNESRSATYGPYDIVHLPTSLLAYKNSSNRKFSLNGKLISRNPGEAIGNLRYLDLIRSWILPDVGVGGTGATPPILQLSAYGNRNIRKLNVVLINYDWGFPEDVDYIYTTAQPMPVIGMLTLTLEEIYSPEEITARAWTPYQTQGGSFQPGIQRDKATLSDVIIQSKINPNAKLQEFGSADAGINDLYSGVTNLLGQGVRPTLAGVIAGNLTRSLGSKFVNSPQVQSVLTKMPTFARNVFTAGANGAVTDLGRDATIRVSQATTATSPSDPFATSAPLKVREVLGD